jgi:hypothetical protein
MLYGQPNESRNFEFYIGLTGLPNRLGLVLSPLKVQYSLYFVRADSRARQFYSLSLR